VGAIIRAMADKITTIKVATAIPTTSCDFSAIITPKTYFSERYI
jgi:hypothetical protein